MTIAERLHGETLTHLSMARRAVKELTACTADWSAGVLLEVDFDALEETCREFGRCQFGLPAATPENPEK